MTERSEMFRFARHDGSPLSRYATALPKGEPRSERLECGRAEALRQKSMKRKMKNNLIFLINTINFAEIV